MIKQNIQTKHKRKTQITQRNYKYLQHFFRNFEMKNKSLGCSTYLKFNFSYNIYLLLVYHIFFN